MQLKKLENHPQHENLYPVNSKHFTEFALTSNCKVSKFRKQNELTEEDKIFVEYNIKPKHAKIRDVLLKYRVSCIIL